jgi:hypothetical protein
VYRLYDFGERSIGRGLCYVDGATQTGIELLNAKRLVSIFWSCSP